MQNEGGIDMKIRTKLMLSNIVIIGIPVGFAAALMVVINEKIASDYFEQAAKNIFKDAPFVWKDVLPYIGGSVLVVLLILIALIVVMSIWISGSILKPLQRLSVASGLIRDGNLDFEITSRRKDEIGQLTNDFNKMRKYLKKSVDERIEYEKYRKDLIVGISHDLRTPLTSVKGYVEGLRDGVASSDKMKNRYYDAIETSVSNMEALVDELTGFSRLELEEYHYDFEKTDLNAFYKECAENLEDEYFRDDLKVSCETGSGELYADIDRKEMMRINRNLTENTIKYNDEGDPEITFRITSDGENALIAVEDSGPGVEESKLGSIFNIFYRGDRARTSPGKGSGIGLAVVKKIVEAHGGSVSAENIVSAYAGRNAGTAGRTADVVNTAGRNAGLRIIVKLPLCMNENGNDRMLGNDAGRAVNKNEKENLEI